MFEAPTGDVRGPAPVQVPLAAATVMVATFSVWRQQKRTSLSGQLWPLLRFLRPRARRVAIIDNPIAESDYRTPNFEAYEGERLVARSAFPKVGAPLWYIAERQRHEAVAPLRFKLRDITADLYFGLRQRGRCDLYIGVDAINATAGVILRRLGKVKRVVFYETDYVPQRFANPAVNRAYLALDRLACRHADWVWNVTPAIAKERARAGYAPAGLAPQLTVPVGTFPEQIHAVPYSELEPGHIVYAGGFSEQNGVWTLLEVIRRACARVPRARATILGWGPATIEAEMRAIIAAHGLEDRVEIPGFLADHREVERILSRAWVGIAPFRALPNSTKRFGDVSKLRMYLSCGIPVVTTDVTYIAGEIGARQAGLVVADDVDQLTDATVRLLTEAKTHRRLRENAVEMARDNTWDRVFADACEAMGMAVSPGP